MRIKNKRVFDLTIVIATSPVWLTIFLNIYFILFISGHWPVLFGQKRVLSGGKIKKIFKFRSMNPKKVKKYFSTKALKLEKQTGFISIDKSSGVYTKRGILLESFKLVELPELFYVISGDLSLVGNRPLPLDQQEILEKQFTEANKRLLTKAGIFGVIQMAGRENFSVEERINLEVIYSKTQYLNYSPKRDFIIIIITLLKIFGFQLVKEPKIIQKIIIDNSFSILGRLIIAKIKASNPIKK